MLQRTHIESHARTSAAGGAAGCLCVFRRIATPAGEGCLVSYEGTGGTAFRMQVDVFPTYAENRLLAEHLAARQGAAQPPSGDGMPLSRIDAQAIVLTPGHRTRSSAH